MKNPMFDIRAMFPKSSASFKAANPHLGLQTSNQNSVAVNVGRKKANLGGGDATCHQIMTVDHQPCNAAPKFNPLGRGKMNKTEAAYALLLEAQVRKGEILSYHFQGLTLRWPVGNEIVRYTPDFVVFPYAIAAAGNSPLVAMRLIEVKGGYRKFPGYLERAIERFRHAKTRWPQFSFEMHQKQRSGWKQIL